MSVSQMPMRAMLTGESDCLKKVGDELLSGSYVPVASLCRIVKQLEQTTVSNKLMMEAKTWNLSIRVIT